jgi:hypothetical protein
MLHRFQKIEKLSLKQGLISDRVAGIAGYSEYPIGGGSA